MTSRPESARRCAICFGDDKKTGEKTTTTSIDPALANASRTNINRFSNLADQGYQAYTGPRVADLTNDQTSAYGTVRALAGTSNPYTALTQGAATNAATAGPQQVSTVRSIDNVPGQGAAGSTQDYMDPYLQAVLAPQLADLDEESARNTKATDAAATMAGAFGDAGWGFQKARDADLGRRARQSAIGNTYSAAFNNAMALKNNDINRLLDVGKSNAALNEQGLARALAGGQALTDLDKYNTGRTADLAALEENAGKAQQGNEQAKLDAAYQEYTKGHLSQGELYQLLLSSINGSPLKSQSTSNTVTEEPDNTGWGMVGSLAGTAMKTLPAVLPLMASDRRVKENVVPLGALADGQTVYRFNYIGDPMTHIGLMAQEVEQHTPDAVHEIGGIKHVDYVRATERAAALMGH